MLLKGCNKGTENITAAKMDPLRSLLGSCLYRFIVAVALRFNVPAAAMKLVSALIVAIAIASPTLRQLVGFQKLKWKRKAQYGGKTEKAAAGTEKEEK